MKLSLSHYLGLVGIIFLGLLLRFWNLDLKPLWLDEVITALFSLGQGYDPIPLGITFNLSTLNQFFRLQPQTTCPQVAQLVSEQSVHPPLFFCALHTWLGWFFTADQSLAWNLRVFPALIGVGAIAAIYALNRVAFSAAAGLMGAALMAVSPFAVYLSQEARHYTLPLLLITLALLGLIQIQQDLCTRRQLRPWVWLGWIVVNSLGFYVHYFFLLAFIAQVVSLIGLLLWQHPRIQRRHWGAVGLAIAAVVITYLPWLPTLIGHTSRPETDWLSLTNVGWTRYLAPLYQTLAGWVIMVITLPTEGQPLWVAIPMGILMILFAGWVCWQSCKGIRQCWRDPQTRISTGMLLSFTLCILLEYLAIIYILGKDITIAPRYNFTYYPGICALLGAGLVAPQRTRLFSGQRRQKHLRKTLPLMVGILSCAFVVNNLAFLKPFAPEQIARDITQESSPRSILMAYDSTQDVALGLSVALEVEKLSPGTTNWGFFQRRPIGTSEESIWQTPPKIQQPLATNLWVLGTQWQPTDFPPQLRLNQSLSGKSPELACSRVPSQYSSIGIPHQLYQCRR